MIRCRFPILSRGTDDLNLSVDPARAVDGLRPFVLAHVRLGERGAPVYLLRCGCRLIVQSVI